VLRLASLLWRLCRATTMETGLFEIQADHLNGFRQARQVQQPLERLFYALFGRAESASFDRDAAPANITNGIESFAGSAPKSVELAADPAAKLARCFLRLANLPNYALDRLSRYEATLWRQVRQILFALDDRRKPQDRGRRFRVGSWQCLPTYERQGMLAFKRADRGIARPDWHLIGNSLVEKFGFVS
jgi:hypothetical protein